MGDVAMPELQETMVKALKEGRAEIDLVKKAGGETSEKAEKAMQAFAGMAEKLQAMEDAEKSRIVGWDTEKKEFLDKINGLEASVARGLGTEKAKGRTGSEKYRVEFHKYLFRGLQGIPSIDTSLMEEKSLYESIGLSTKGLFEGSDPSLGMLVPMDLSNMIATRLWETSPMRQHAFIYSTMSNAVKMVRDDVDTDAFWVGEADEHGSANVALGDQTIEVHMLVAIIKMTIELQEDGGAAIESFINRKIASKMARKQNSAFVNGDGVKKPFGFLSYADAPIEEYQSDAIGTMETLSTSVIEADELMTLQSSLQEGYQPNSKFFMHRKTFVEIAKLKGGDDHYLLNPSGLFRDGVGMMLLGSPVVMFGDMSKGIVSGEVAVMYADMRELYTIVERTAMQMLVDPYSSTGYTTLKSHSRVGGAVTNTQAGKRLRIKS